MRVKLIKAKGSSVKKFIVSDELFNNLDNHIINFESYPRKYSYNDIPIWPEFLANGMIDNSYTPNEKELMQAKQLSDLLENIKLVEGIHNIRLQLKDE